MQSLVTELTTIIDSLCNHLQHENQVLETKNGVKLEDLYERKALLTEIYQDVLAKVSEQSVMDQMTVEQKRFLSKKLDDLQETIRYNTELLERTQITNDVILKIFQDALTATVNYTKNGQVNRENFMGLTLNQLE